jgi:hypothetical protein
VRAAERAVSTACVGSDEDEYLSPSDSAGPGRLSCARCRRVFWAGSHHARLAEKLERWLAATAG